MKFVLALFLLPTIQAINWNTPPDGAKVVAKSGGDYDTIGKAIMALDSGLIINQTIFIKSGIYNEQVEIPALRGHLTIYGETANTASYSTNTVTVTHNISAARSSGDETATIRNSAAASRIYNINVVNSHGPGNQALALSATGTQQGYYGCQFDGYNGTIRTQVGGTTLFAKSLISGTTSRGRYTSEDGYITANCRANSNDPSYLVINNSTVEAINQSVKTRSYFLGRPESSFARVVFQNTYMSDVVNSAGWSQWSPILPNTANVLFGEYQNSGPGSQGTRASFATALSSPVAIADLLDDGYESWVDLEYLKD